jgi:plasmid stabilization system protein ParE
MRIRLSRQASNFVRKETKYLNDRSPSAAEKFLNSIKEAKKTLLQFPKIGNGAHGLHIKDALTFVVGDYLLDYIPDVEFVDIINIRHGRMLQMKTLLALPHQNSHIGHMKKAGQQC